MFVECFEWCIVLLWLGCCVLVGLVYSLVLSFLLDLSRVGLDRLPLAGSLWLLLSGVWLFRCWFVVLVERGFVVCALLAGLSFDLGFPLSGFFFFFWLGWL